MVTGASSGIGRELAVQLAGRAGTLALTARRKDRLEGLREQLTGLHPRLEVTVIAADLSDDADVERLLTELRYQVGDVDVLVNNAGVGYSTLFDRGSWARTRKLLATNVVAATRLANALVPPMVARGRGGVMNIGSGAGFTVMTGAAAYTASKHFMDGFSEALRADLAGTGVVVTQVCPGPVESGFDEAAGSVGGMTGGLPAFMRISAEQCAREALAGFDRGATLVFPGQPYRFLMRLLPFMPRRVVRLQTARLAKMLRAAEDEQTVPTNVEFDRAHAAPER